MSIYDKAMLGYDKAMLSCREARLVCAKAMPVCGKPIWIRGQASPLREGPMCVGHKARSLCARAKPLSDGNNCLRAGDRFLRERVLLPSRNMKGYVLRVVMRKICTTATRYNGDMNVRYHVDPATGRPHIYQHNVSEDEVEDVLGRPFQDRAGREGSRVSIGQTQAGRYLKVIYVPDPVPEFCVCHYGIRTRSEG